MNVGYNNTIENQQLTVLQDKSIDSNKYAVWHIEGGLGKNIAATSLIKDVREKYSDRKLIMVVSYPEVFLNNPFIDRVYRVGATSYFYDDYIKDKDTIVFRHEPYFQSDHIMKKKHLISNWCDLFNINYTSQIPELYSNIVQNTFLRNWKRDRPIMLLHTNGGFYESNQSYSWTRDIPFPLALSISEKYSAYYHIIQIAKPSSNLVPNVEHLTHRMSNFELFSLLAASEKRILIDSSLQHASVAMGIQSIVLWIGTSPTNFGYDFHKNIVAKTPKNNLKLIDSYLFDYSFDGLHYECPYLSFEEMFDVNEIFENIEAG